MSEEDSESREVREEFTRVVNMTPAKLRAWLASDASREVGMTAEGEKVTKAANGEAVGHKMGERILELRATRQADLTADDYAAMSKVIGYVHRHMAQRPSGDVTDTRWRKSLMNWGHDPLK